MKIDWDKESAKEFVQEYIEKEEKAIKNGEAKLQAVVDSLKEHPFIDVDYVWDKPEDYKYSVQDFRDVFQYLETKAGDHIHNGDCEHFPEFFAYFNLNGSKFLWRLLIGQGSALQLISADYEHIHEYAFDENKEIIL